MILLLLLSLCSCGASDMQQSMATDLATDMGSPASDPQGILGGGFATVGGGSWYRADDAVLVSGNVDSVPDRNGGPALRAPDAPGRPMFEAAGLGGKPSLLGDGVTNRMSVDISGTPLAAGSRPWFWFVLQKPNSTIQPSHQWLGFYDGGPTLLGIYEFIYTAPDGQDPGNTGTVSIFTKDFGLSKATLLTAPQIFEVSFGPSQDMMVRNGTKMIQLSPDYPAGMVSTVPTLWYWCDNNGGTNNCSNLRIAEIIWTRSEPSEGQKIALRQYASTRYGIPIDAGITGGRQLTVAGQSNGMFLIYLTEPNNWPVCHKRFLNRISTTGPPQVHNNQGYWDSSESSVNLFGNWQPGSSTNLAMNLRDSIDAVNMSPASVILWWQGESDPNDQQAYHDNFITMQNYVESGAGRTDLLWLIVREHAQSTGMTPGVRAAEEQLCNESSRRVLIDIDDLPAPHDGLHFWPAQYEAVLARARSAARTYFGDPGW